MLRCHAAQTPVVMVEHVVRGVDGSVSTDRAAGPGQFINPQGCEARAGETLLSPGKRLGFADIALLATVGKSTVAVCPKPRVALLATGDEIVPITETPREHQIRNSNVYSLAAQVTRAGGVPVILPVARDELDDTLALVERGLQADLLLISGGVSAGKYDVVERALAETGAEFFFDRVLIQPGQPLVFGRSRDRFFFGLPGNPASTMVTFELFARAALELLGGQSRSELPLLLARLTRDFRHKTGLTRFLPAVARLVRPRAPADSHDLERFRRCGGSRARQCVSGCRCRSRRMESRRIDAGPAEMKKLSHYDSAGSPRMVDVSAKPTTKRTARAHAFVRIQPEILAKLPENPKGNPLEIARIAGIAAAKKTSELIPLCHPADALPCRRGRSGRETRRAHHRQCRNHGPDRRRNGGAHGRSGCRAHCLRHDKGARQVHFHRRTAPRRKDRRQERRLPAEGPEMKSVAVLTVSDSVSVGKRTDGSGPAVQAHLERLGWHVAANSGGRRRYPGYPGKIDCLRR